MVVLIYLFWQWSLGIKTQTAGMTDASCAYERELDIFKDLSFLVVDNRLFN